MSIGLIALLDDVAALAKVAAASLDDVAGQAARAGVKAAGVVIDDAAVTPRYVVGFSPAREIPIVWRIARGSLRNKLLFLLPAALALGAFAPWAITPLLMLGGAYLSYEGTEKVAEWLFPHAAHAGVDAATSAPAVDAKALEDQRVASAIKTDFILSAEIMAITLAAVPESGFWTEAFVLAAVAIGITALVYGGVALIVKADDIGLSMATGRWSTRVRSLGRAFGRGLVVGMPYFLKVLAVIGTAAMIWVGGGILLHGLEGYGIAAPAHLLHDASLAVADAVPFGGGLFGWLVTAAGSGIVGLAVGAVLIPLVGRVFAPLWARVRGREAAAH